MLSTEGCRLAVRRTGFGFLPLAEGASPQLVAKHSKQSTYARMLNQEICMNKQAFSLDSSTLEGTKSLRRYSTELKICVVSHTKK